MFVYGNQDKEAESRDCLEEEKDTKETKILNFIQRNLKYEKRM